MNDKRLTPMWISPWWRHATILVMIAGFSTLGVLTALTYKNAPPVPQRVLDEQGQVVFTRENIEHGQEVFFKYGLMEHGTLWGHGAYLGPDYTAAYLHREAEIVQGDLARSKFGLATDALAADQRAAVAVATQSLLKTNRYDEQTGDLVFTAGEIATYRSQLVEWSGYLGGKDPPPGLPSNYIKNPDELKDFTAYLAWATWATVANRPGLDYTYTNNWPYEPLVGNVPSTQAYVWSALSLVTLLGGLGTVLFVFGKFSFLGWKGEGDPADSGEPPVSPLVLTPSQKAIAKYLAVIGLLFLGQTLIGGALAHYRAEPGGFYGIDIAKFIPYPLLRTWHLQLAIFWVATAWVAGGLFLGVWVGGGEPKGQKLGVNVLFGALLLVVVGSLAGEALGLNDMLGKLWFWLGHQGSEYLDLGRLWQLLLAAGLVFWLYLMFRALKPAIREEGKSNLTALFLYASVAIPLFYLPALFFGPRTNFAVIDNWRFWIIHLWVEGFFELFATVLVAIMFRRLGLVTMRTATRLIYLDAILYLSGGIIGTGHHWYFTGQGTLNMGLAACFSAIEVVPLTLLTLDAWDFIKLKDRSRDASVLAMVAKQKWAIYFLMAVGVWNFVGAGVMGFLINLPIVSYFEIGTTLTANHAHAAMFGVFGMLALAVTVFCLRALQSDEGWQRIERLIKLSFWGVNIGLALMVVLDLFPAGVLQLWDAVANGYWHARSLTYTMQGLFHTLEWVRIVGDGIFIVFGAVPVAIACVVGWLGRTSRTEPAG